MEAMNTDTYYCICSVFIDGRQEEQTVGLDLESREISKRVRKFASSSLENYFNVFPLKSKTKTIARGIISIFRCW